MENSDLGPTINTLKAEVDFLDGELAAAKAENERLREWNAEIALNAREFAAENERLRAALEPFACDCGPGGEKPCHKPENCRNHIARAALEG